MYQSLCSSVFSSGTAYKYLFDVFLVWQMYNGVFIAFQARMLEDATLKMLRMFSSIGFPIKNV